MDIRANVRRLLKRSKSGGQTKPKTKANSPPRSPVSDRPYNADQRPSTIELPQQSATELIPPTNTITPGNSDESDGGSVETLAHKDRPFTDLADEERLRLKHENIEGLDNQPTLIVQQPTPTSEKAETPGLLGGSIKNVDLDSNTRDYPSSFTTPLVDSEQSSQEKLISEASISPGALPPPIQILPAGDQPRQSSSSINSANTSILEEVIDAEGNLVAQDEQQAVDPQSAPVVTDTGARALDTAQGDPRPHLIQPVTTMVQRKIWVKRPGASATLVTVRDDDVVDDVRDKVLHKYANSLGRSFDAPDVTIRILLRAEGQRSLQERLLSPEEEMCRVLDNYYPGGQTVEEALIIDIPPKKTPRPSPRSHHHAAYHALDDYRPQESGTDYFPPMPAVVQQPVNGHVGIVHDPRSTQPHVLHLPEHTRSISVLQTGQVPPLPSPGAASRRHRPKYGRQHTSSPTILAHGPTAGAVAVHPPSLTAQQHLSHRPVGRHRSDSNTSERQNGVPAAPPLPTPPAPEAPPTAKAANTPPTPAVREHLQTRTARPRKTRKATPTNGTTTVKAGQNNSIHSLLDGSVPPINVLIVEDNIINLKLLEAFMKRLKVRWSTAMNGQIAVNKWRTGGFHLVLMDIQLPIMSGLEATKEIRRLERVNGIGVFSSSGPSTPLAQGQIKSTTSLSNGTEDARSEEDRQNDKEKDKLVLDEGLFKSPVIIVALTASSLQSDRHEALAAGCNDFLTKPVNFVWLERKVKEWGCMQALIDFDGWRKWKDFSNPTTETKSSAKAGSKSPLLDGVGRTDSSAKLKDRKAIRNKRISAEGSSSASTRNASSEHGNDTADKAA